MDIKELKGTMSVENFVDGLVAQTPDKTLGEIWEDTVDCNHCTYREQCQAISAYYEDKGINLYCNQVIDYLLGDLDVETIPMEV